MYLSRSTGNEVKAEQFKKVKEKSVTLGLYLNKSTGKEVMAVLEKVALKVEALVLYLNRSTGIVVKLGLLLKQLEKLVMLVLFLNRSTGILFILVLLKAPFTAVIVVLNLKKSTGIAPTKEVQFKNKFVALPRNCSGSKSPAGMLVSPVPWKAAKRLVIPGQLANKSP